MFAEDLSIKELRGIENIVECVSDDVFGTSVRNLIVFCDKLPNDYYNNYLKISCIPFLFNVFENLLLVDKNPKVIFDNKLKQLKKDLQESANSSFQNVFNGAQEFNIINKKEDIERITGNHYGNLFKGFSPEKYFDEAKKLLKIRLERNNIDISNISKWKILDQGCGGGRYSVAWSLLGAKKVVGVDISEIGLNDAKKRAEMANINNVEYILGNVLDLPFNNEEFDFVFSNGVLHHTKDWKKGISEQLRVLKKNHYGWQYLIEQPGGIFWDKIEILRMITRNINKNFAIKILEGYGIPKNRIFYMLDHVMVPINTRLKPSELENELRKNGAKNIKRLSRGFDFDRVEHIYNKIPYATEKFGVGENRFIFSK